jgi:transcriptional regulator with XRE-family HTH domain
MVDVKQHIGIKIKAARRQLGLTQAQLAESVDKTVETISNIERGDSLTSIETLQLISEKLGLPLAEFFEGLEKARPRDRRRVELEQEVGLLLQSLPEQDIELAVDLIEVLGGRRRRRNRPGLSTTKGRSG